MTEGEKNNREIYCKEKKITVHVFSSWTEQTLCCLPDYTVVKHRLCGRFWIFSPSPHVIFTPAKSSVMIQLLSWTRTNFLHHGVYMPYIWYCYNLTSWAVEKFGSVYCCVIFCAQVNQWCLVTLMMMLQEKKTRPLYN